MHFYAIFDYLSTYGRGWELDWYTVVEYGTLLGDPSLELVGAGSPPPPPPEPFLEGWVVDTEGNPVAGSTVELYDYISGNLIANQSSIDGYFRFTSLSHGTYTIIARAPGYCNRSVDFYYPHIPIQLNVTLTPLPSFSFPTVLIVVDDDAPYKVDEGVWPLEFASVAASMGFYVYVWNESKQGRPPLEWLLHTNVTVVVWHTGTYYGGVVDSFDAQNLISFVNSGGSLLLEGEDIGYDHRNDTFMYEVAHAAYLTDYVDTDGVVATRRHFLTDGLQQVPFSAEPPFPDGVVPVNEGFEVMRYSKGALLRPYSAVVAYDGSPAGKGRVVYIAFPAHYLNTSGREALLQRALLWLSTRYRLSLSLSSSAFVPGGVVVLNATPYNGTTPMTNLSVTAEIFFPNGTLLTIVQLVDDGTGYDRTANDGVYTGALTVPSTAPEGVYTVIAYAVIPGYGREYANSSFNVYAQVSAVVNVTGVSVTEGIIQLNVSVSTMEGIAISGVEFCVDLGDVSLATPADGAFDEPSEDAVVMVNATVYPDGVHHIYVRVRAGSVISDWISVRFKVRTLSKGYNLIALSIEPRGRLYAADIARMVGSSLSAIWRWDVQKQEFIGYVPGVSGPEKNFEVEMGYGYFVFLQRQAKLVEVEGMGA